MDNIIERIPKTRLLVKPAKRPSVQNRHLQEGKILDGNQVLNKGPLGKIKATGPNGRSCVEGVVFKTDDSGIRLLAGMGAAVSPNPFKDLDAEEVITTYSLSSKWRGIIEKIVEQESISQQQYLEILAGVDPDTYTERISGKRTGQFYDPEAEKNVLQEMEVKLYDQTNIFDSSSPMGRLEMQCIKSRPDKIAPSLDELNTSIHNFYIAEEHEEFILSKKKNDLVNEAIAEYVTLQKKQPDHVLYQIASILTDPDNRVLVKGETTPLHVEEVINSFIKTTGKHQLRNVDKFLEAVKLHKNNPDLFHVHYVVQVASNKGIFTDSNGYIFWNSRREQPEHYKFTSRNQLINFLFAEQDKYDPEDDQKFNAYGELLSELADKGVKINN